MERHGRVEGDTLIIGNMAYKKVIIPPHIAFFENTEKLLAEFKANGGLIVTADELPANPVIDNPAITYTFRDFPAEAFTLRHSVHSTAAEQRNVCGVHYGVNVQFRNIVFYQK